MFPRLITISIAILSWGAWPAFAQSTSFHGPICGFAYSRSARTIRPLLGVTGAARLGSPLMAEVDFASIGPDGQWALISQSGSTTFVHGFGDLAPSVSPAAGLIDTVDRVLWNRGGSVALLYSSSANRLQRVQLSASGPAADTPLDLSPWGAATALAIDPAGSQIAFGVPGSGLYLFSAGQSPVLLSSMAQPAEAAFDSSGRRLFAVDLDQQRIALFDYGSSATKFASLEQPDASPITPMGLAVSGDGLHLLLVDGAAHAVRVYDTGSGSLSNIIPLDFAPSRFEALSPAPTFLLNGDHRKEWLMVLDASRTPAISFVPAINEEVQ
jgi:hypothetical protein